MILNGRRSVPAWASLYWHTDRRNGPARALHDRFCKADGFVRYRLKLT